MSNKKIYWAGAAVLIGLALVLSGCGKKTTTTNTNTVKNINVVSDEAPYTMESGTKVFALTLVNGHFAYSKMTFRAGDAIKVTLAENGQPVEFEFVNPNVKSSNGAFYTTINNTDPGGTYQLRCQLSDCGIITVTVINPNPPANANTAANANSSAGTNVNSPTGVTKIELQRLPAGTTFSPNVNMATTDQFQVGDQFGIGVTGTFKSGDKKSQAIVDSNGTVVDPRGMETDLTTGTNGNCCFAVPGTAGNYSVKVYVNGTEAGSTPLIVSAK